MALEILAHRYYIVLMDLQFPISFATFALILSLVFLFLKKSKKKNAKRLPPSPPELPIIGHVHLLGSIPHRSFRDLAKKYGPIMHLKLGETSTIVVSSPKIAKEVLKTQDPTFATRAGTLALEIIFYDLTAVSFSPYNDYWKQMRKIATMELLSAKQVKFYESIRNVEVLNLIKSIKSSAGKTINLTEKVTAAISASISRATFGKICRNKEEFIKITIDAKALSGGFDLSDLYPSSKILRTLSWKRIKLLAMRRKVDKILDGIIDEHRQSYARTTSNGDGEMDQSPNLKRRGNGEFGNEDLVDVLLRVKENADLKFPISNDNIKAIISEMFSAGTDPAASTINWAMAELIKNPRVMAKAQAEVREAAERDDQLIDIENLKYLKLVIKETLRLHPSLTLIPRACREDCEIEGYLIPANARVFVNAWEIGRDPKYWTNPESFEPERFENITNDWTGNNFEYLPFGAGRRVCPGMTHGLTSVELTLAQLLKHFDWKLPQGTNPDNLDLTETAGLTVWKKEHLYLVATPYK